MRRRSGRRTAGVLGAVATVATAAVLVGQGVSTAGSATDQGIVPQSGVVSSAARAAQDRKIVMTLNSNPSLKMSFDTIASLAASSYTKAVITGTVTKTEDLYVDSVAYRVLTVDVAETRKAKARQIVTIYEDGGVIPYAEVLPDLQDHSDQKLTPASGNDYVDFRFMGAPHTQVGDQIVAFVQPNPNGSDLIPADYQLISSVQGLLVKDAATGTYLRRGIEEESQPNAERSITAARLDSTLTARAGKAIG